MGSSSKGPSAEEQEMTRLQNERLRQEQEAAERLKKENKAMMDARRQGGMGGLLQGSEEGEKGGYRNLLGG